MFGSFSWQEIGHYVEVVTLTEGCWCEQMCVAAQVPLVESLALPSGGFNYHLIITL